MRREYRIYESKKTLLKRLSILLFCALILFILFNLLDDERKSYILVIILTFSGEIVLLAESIKIIKKLNNKEALLRINRKGIVVSKYISQVGLIEYGNIDYCEFKELYIPKRYGIERKNVLRIIFKIENYNNWHSLDVPIDGLDEPSNLLVMLDRYNVKIYN